MVEDCDRQASSRGYCASLRPLGEMGRPVRREAAAAARLRRRRLRPSCLRRGLCISWARWRRKGSTELLPATERARSTVAAVASRRGFCSTPTRGGREGKKSGTLERFCEVDGCDRPLYGRVLPDASRRWRTTGDHEAQPERQPKGTQLCLRRLRRRPGSRGFCDTTTTIQEVGCRAASASVDEERFLEKIDKSEAAAGSGSPGQGRRYRGLTVNDSCTARERYGSTHREMMATATLRRFVGRSPTTTTSTTLQQLPLRQPRHWSR